MKTNLLLLFLDKLVLVTFKACCKVPFWSQARGVVRSCRFAALKCLSFTSMDWCSSCITVCVIFGLSRRDAVPGCGHSETVISLCFTAAVPSTLVHTSLRLSYFPHGIWASRVSASPLGTEGKGLLLSLSTYQPLCFVCRWFWGGDSCSNLSRTCCTAPPLCCSPTM